MNQLKIPPELQTKLVEFILKISEKTVSEFFGIIEDQIRFWRFNNQINILINATNNLEKKGISPQKVNLKVLVPLLEYASLEEEKFMQEKWIQLLVTAADPNEEVEILTSFPEILKELSSVEVKILDYLYSNIKCNDGLSEKRFTFDEIRNHLNISKGNLGIYINNLTRLGLCIIPVKANFDGSWATIGGGKLLPINSTNEITLTELGYIFIRTCTGKK